MTAHFAIPATTFVLQGILQRRLDAVYIGFNTPPVLAEPPPRPPSAPVQPDQPQAAEAPALYLFLHHAGPNPAWRNMYEPHVSGLDGKRMGPAPLALDLHYMLAATGARLEREVLLGTGIHALTRNAIVPRPMIQAILGAIAVPNPPVTLMDSLTAEPLDDPARQPEQITISQAPVDIDMSTKLWSALQAPLRPCAYFLVTTVFLDLDEVFPAVQPVDEVAVAVVPDPTADPTEVLS